MYTVMTASGAPLAQTSTLSLADLAVIRLNSHYGPRACHILYGDVAPAPEQPLPHFEHEGDCELMLGLLARLHPELGGLLTEPVYLLRGMLWTQAQCVQGVWMTYAASTEDAQAQLLSR